MRFPSSGGIFVHCNCKSSLKGQVNLISVLANFPQRRIVPPHLKNYFHREAKISLAVTYSIIYVIPLYGLKILIVFSRQNMACVKTNQTSFQLPKQIKIFKIIDAKTDSVTCKRQFVKTTHFKNVWSSTNFTVKLNIRCWNLRGYERNVFRHRVKVVWHSSELHRF
jgi:hypothetical protein